MNDNDTGRAPAAGAKPRTVLVVEDEPLIAMELADRLQEKGWDAVHVAGTVGEALQLLADGLRPDAATLDVNLGGELVHVLADRLRLAGVPFVFCTGYAELLDKERYAQCAVLRKPIDIDALSTALAHAARF